VTNGHIEIHGNSLEDPDVIKTKTDYFRGHQTFWSEGRIGDCLATGGTDTVRFT